MCGFQDASKFPVLAKPLLYAQIRHDNSSGDECCYRPQIEPILRSELHSKGCADYINIVFPFEILLMSEQLVLRRASRGSYDRMVANGVLVRRSFNSPKALMSMIGLAHNFAEFHLATTLISNMSIACVRVVHERFRSRIDPEWWIA
jgi:hypothetical protein